MLKGMLKVQRLKFLQKNVILSRERAGVVVSRNSFSECYDVLSFILHMLLSVEDSRPTVESL